MELNMRYAVAADGVRIAYATAGQGISVIRAPFSVFSHCQLEWRQSDFFEKLSRSRMVIPYDPRGSGLSDRDVTDFSLEARELDIDAVAGALGLPQFALHGIRASGPSSSAMRSSAQTGCRTSSSTTPSSAGAPTRAPLRAPRTFS
jgi:hypothetical protein